AGLDTPTAGSVAVAGRDLARMSREELARYRRSTVGMVFQAFNLVAAMTVLENVELPMRFAEVPREQRLTRARTAIERVGLGHRVSSACVTANWSTISPRCRHEDRRPGRTRYAKSPRVGAA